MSVLWIGSSLYKLGVACESEKRINMALDIESALLLDSEDSVSKAISKMSISRKSECVVLKKGRFLGVIHARDISKRNINDPHSIKIKKFVKKIKIFPVDSDLESIIKTVTKNNYKFALIKKGKDFFVLTKLNAIKALSGKSFLDKKTAKDIMKSPFCVGSEDSISTGVSLFRELKISVLPVLNRRGSVEGFVNAVDLLRADTARKKSQGGEKAGEAIKLRGVYVNSLMQKNFPKAKPSSTASELVKIMGRKNIPFVFIEDRKMLLGIVTTGDILRLLTEKKESSQKTIKPEERVYFSISGVDEEDPFIRKVLDEEISSEMRKLSRIIPIESSIFHVNGHHTAGKRTKYSVKARLLTRKGDFFAEDYSWDLTKAAKGVLQKLEKETIKKKRKARVYRRSP